MAMNMEGGDGINLRVGVEDRWWRHSARVGSESVGVVEGDGTRRVGSAWTGMAARGEWGRRWRHECGVGVVGGGGTRRVGSAWIGGVWTEDHGDDVEGRPRR